MFSIENNCTGFEETNIILNFVRIKQKLSCEKFYQIGFVGNLKINLYSITFLVIVQFCRSFERLAKKLSCPNF